VDEGCETPHEPLNVLDVPDLTHFNDGPNLVRVCFDTALGDDVAQELALGDLEGAFHRVQLNVEPPEVVEGFFNVRDEAAALLILYHDVVDIDL
jgi:hypothetical protein